MQIEIHSEMTLDEYNVENSLENSQGSAQNWFSVENIFYVRCRCE